MSIVIFAGPTVSGLALSDFPQFDFRPPAGCGDILKAVHSGASAIGLIDGVFQTSPSVWHKEILLALHREIPVFGAASMGALRAAECSPFGMVGYGKIFTEYLTGKREADSDVAVVYGPAELKYVPLSIALVDVEATLHNAQAFGALKAIQIDQIFSVARHLHFSDRTWRSIVQECGFSPTMTTHVLDCICRYRKSQKAEDALILLSTLANLKLSERLVRENNRFIFNRTAFLNALECRLGVRQNG